jgi:hypothetical protein
MSEYRRQIIAAVSITIIGVLALAGAAVYFVPTQGLGGPFRSVPIVTIVPDSVICTSYASCHITLENTGAASAWISGAGPASGSVTFSTCPAVIGAPGNTTFNLAISGGIAGKSVQGYFVSQDVSGGTNQHLDFTVVLPLVGPNSTTPITCGSVGTVTNSTVTSA